MAGRLSHMSNLKAHKDNSETKDSFKRKAYQFSLKIIAIVDNLPKKRASWVISDQILRSSTSIGANIAEAKSASSRRDFIKYYEISLKSANQTLYWLGLVRDASLIDKNSIEGLIQDCQELCRIIAASIITLKGKRKY